MAVKRTPTSKATTTKKASVPSGAPTEPLVVTSEKAVAKKVPAKKTAAKQTAVKKAPAKKAVRKTAAAPVVEEITVEAVQVGSVPLDITTEIATLAYYRWESRGRVDGYADADWLEAEHAVRAKYNA